LDARNKSWNIGKLSGLIRLVDRHHELHAQSFPIVLKLDSSVLQCRDLLCYHVTILLEDLPSLKA